VIRLASSFVLLASSALASCSTQNDVAAQPTSMATDERGPQGGSSGQPIAGQPGSEPAGGSSGGSVGSGGAGGGSSGAAAGAAGGSGGGETPIAVDPKPNVLLIMVDDLNDWAGYLGGHPQARTPHLDRLAAQGFAFQHAYASSPSCNPSRAAMMLGKHPNSTGLYSNLLDGMSPTIDMRHHFPDKVTLPQYFQSQGYRTFRSGKVFHYWGDWMDDEQTVDGSFQEVNNGPNRIDPGPRWPLSGIDWGDEKYIDWGAFDQPYSDFEAYSRASVIEGELQKQHTQPFFVAAGFYLPHLPWYYPKSVLDEPELAHIKNVADVQLPKVLPNDLDDLGDPARRVAKSADSAAKSLDAAVTYASWHQAITETGKWQEAVQAYLASIYFVDLQIGRILDALEASPHSKNTIVALVGDHGWMLGEKQAWSKYKPWEDAVRTHFIIRVPGVAGRRIDEPIGLVSLYRTLVDLAGLPEKQDLDGRSLRPLLESSSAEWGHAVVSAHDDWNEGWQTVRDNRYRLIRYMKDGSEELYDHETDPEEWTNVASDPSYAQAKSRLGQLIPTTMTALGSWGPATP
jgi:arylsulfatase A-like enzyme